MTVMASKPDWRVFICLTILLASVIINQWCWQHYGFSAIFLLGVFSSTLVLIKLLALYHQQQKQLQSVMQALANGDPTLGLVKQHPLRRQFDQVKQQIQSARLNAEAEAQFLQAILCHLDSAVLVVNESGKIMTTNPACSRLFNRKITHLTQLDKIGQFIQQTNHSCSTTIKWQPNQIQETLSLQLNLAMIQGRQLKIISLQSISTSIANNEQQAYQRLTKVLTHEMANSMTPLASLAETSKQLLILSVAKPYNEQQQDLCLCIDTIASRTQHLSQFIANFRQINNLPKPSLSLTAIVPLVSNAIHLCQHHAGQQTAQITNHITIHTQLMLDAVQIEQVLINILKNALESSASNSDIAITVTAQYIESDTFVIDIQDNGPGMAEHIIEMAFVPFFSTKTQGSGIGLSLSKQTMLNHGGDLIYVKQPQGACFRLIF